MLRQEQEQEQEQQQEEENEFLYRNFVNAIKSKTTKADYTRRIKYLIDFLAAAGGPAGSSDPTNYSILLDPKKDKKMIEADIKSFLVFLRKKKKLSYRSALQYFNSVKKFYYVNSDFDFKWNLIKMYLGNDDTDDDDDSNNESLLSDQVVVVEADRPYTRSEIQTMIKTATDIRSKIIILLMSSSGMRHGAIPLLKLKNLTKIEKYNLYQITVYQNSRKHNYKTFCTPECTNLIDSYLNYRKHAGENLRDESPLLREQFNSFDINKFKINNPKHIGISLVRYLVNEVLTKHSALRKKLPYDYQNRRREQKSPTMLTHAFRKFFDTEARKAGMYPDFVELLMGHKLQGVRSHYFKPDTQTLLEGTQDCKGYLHAINDLTINDEYRLSKTVQELTEKKDYQQYIIDKKIQEKDEQINVLSTQLKDIAKQIQEINQRTKVDPETLRRIRSGEMTSDESFELFLKDRERKKQKQDELNQQIQKVLF